MIPVQGPGGIYYTVPVQGPGGIYYTRTGSMWDIYLYRAQVGYIIIYSYRAAQEGYIIPIQGLGGIYYTRTGPK